MDRRAWHEAVIRAFGPRRGYVLCVAGLLVESSNVALTDAASQSVATLCTRGGLRQDRVREAIHALVAGGWLVASGRSPRGVISYSFSLPSEGAGLPLSGLPESGSESGDTHTAEREPGNRETPAERAPGLRDSGLPESGCYPSRSAGATPPAQREPTRSYPILPVERPVDAAPSHAREADLDPLPASLLKALTGMLDAVGLADRILDVRQVAVSLAAAHPEASPEQARRAVADLCAEWAGRPPEDPARVLAPGYARQIRRRMEADARGGNGSPKPAPEPDRPMSGEELIERYGVDENGYVKMPW